MLSNVADVMNILVTGSIGYDYIMDYPGRFADRIMADKIHKISLSFLVDTLTKQFGGTAGNIGYTLNLLGITPVILSAAGNDFSPYRAFLSGCGIDTSEIAVYGDVPTGSYFVVTDADDNQIGSFYKGATKYAAKLPIRSVAKKRHLDFAVVSPTEPKAMALYVSELQKSRIPYMYDPAFQIGAFTQGELESGIRGAAVFIANDYEVSLVEEKLGVSHEELLTMVPLVVTTIGSKGSIIENRKESIHVKPAKPKNVSDPTGAGDAYRAGFLAGFVRGYDLVTCGQMGSVSSVYTVEKYGTVTHHFTKQAFLRRFSENFGRTITL